jgi:hypothetical protein
MIEHTNAEGLMITISLFVKLKSKIMKLRLIARIPVTN